MNAELSQFLSQMGLTEYEARTLATLFILKEAEAPDVARVAEVPKTRVYDVLDKLVAQGLAITLVSRPKKYRALESNDVFEKLVKGKETELAQLRENAQQLTQRMSRESASAPPLEERVMKVKSRIDFYKILAQEIDSAQTNVNGLSALDVHHHILHDSLRKASARGVKVQLAGEHPDTFTEAAAGFGDNVFLKQTKHGMHTYVIDGKKVIMALSDLKQERPEYHFAIWPKHEALAHVLNGHFANVWGNNTNAPRGV